VKYLFLMPTGFVFSGVLTESLFLVLSVAAFRAAQVGVWWAAGVAGGLAALTRPTGVLLPAGLGVFMLFNWHLTGDPLAFVHTQKAWMKSLSNPVEVLLRGVGADVPQLRVGRISGLRCSCCRLGWPARWDFRIFSCASQGC